MTDTVKIDIPVEKLRPITTPCPACGGDPERMESCSYCAGLGECYGGRAHYE